MQPTASGVGTACEASDKTVASSPQGFRGVCKVSSCNNCCGVVGANGDYTGPHCRDGQCGGAFPSKTSH